MLDPASGAGWSGRAGLAHHHVHSTARRARGRIASDQSGADCAVLPLMVRRARGDMSFAGAFMLLTTLGTVLFLPLLAPMLIKGLTVDAWSLAKPLLIMVLLPLLIGGAIRVLRRMQRKDSFLWSRRLAGSSWCSSCYSHWCFTAATCSAHVGALRSWSSGPVPGRDHGDLVQDWLRLEATAGRSMAIGMCTRNIAAVFAAYLGITNPPPGMFVMVILVVPLAAIVALAACARVRFVGSPNR